MHITVVQGTARTNNHSQRVAAAIVAALQQSDATVVQTSVAEHVTKAVTVPAWGEGGADTQPTAWKALVEQTDRFVFVIPEYNHSFPGEWKLLMDTLFPEYRGKVAFVATVSDGQFAGVRVMEHVLPVLANFKFTLGAARLHIGQVDKRITDDGTVTDATTQERLKKFAETVVAR